MEKIHILAISGSLRQKSFNSALIHEAVKLGPANMELEFFPINNIPLYNHDEEVEGFPAPVQELRDKIELAQAVLIATPEYNHSLPGTLKNAIDWASRPPKNLFDSKVVGIMGVTDGGFGTARSQQALRQVLNYLNSFTMNKPELQLSKAKEIFNEDLELIDPSSQEKVRKFLETFMVWILRVSAL